MRTLLGFRTFRILGNRVSDPCKAQVKAARQEASGVFVPSLTWDGLPLFACHPLARTGVNSDVRALPKTPK